ncbi:type 1 glutamine amidotransferase [Aliarcobacter cryaerophilus]|uniref:type 1 glutamine amidotransferase n=1 Tax=Aliarcobacter cryaerophilus TaxID=28198 RepID=UPI0021B4B5E0|nr:type 1 glutamine amidotransferase [Aliarcobacter cryaerophilus]MCT7523246.1 type 1 glutamine amidotransferase [Aliarcobacter cryaerophilus]
MRKILISQRVDYIENIDEIRDCLDIRWAELLYSLGFLIIPLCSSLSNKKDYIKNLNPDGIILSGGNDIGSNFQRDKLESMLLEYSIKNNIPVLGICRGMQMINHYLGGSLKKIENHVAKKHKIKGVLAEKFNMSKVNSYHNFAIQSLGKNLEILAVSEDGNIEAIKHNKYPWIGIMWHPEREKEFIKSDKDLIIEIFKN